MSLLETLTGQLQQLEQRAQQLDQQVSAGKPQHWFDSALFSCHSPKLADYVHEAQRNLQRLQQSEQRLSAAARQRLAEHLHQQVAALSRAFVNQHNRLPTRRLKAVAPVVAKTQAASSQQLYQQLSEYKQFEQRLQDMISQAQRHNSGGAEDVQGSVDRTLVLHARLGRCRKAIAEVEAAIMRLDTGA
ncbi:primosomal replication protein PriC [Arsukibacterium sp.]|uniref:primosomal replication protein PriC n=1 Tax=Arsukibacterium sp. TaxID=1977258 RepID=UPI002FDB491C